MIVEYSTRFPFVSEIEVEEGEGEWRKPLEKSRYSDVARFTIRVLPGVSRSKANKTVFITGQGGNLFDVYEALRCKTRGNNRRGVATCPNPCSEWWRCYLWGRVNDSTWRRFRWQLLKKNGMEGEISWDLLVILLNRYYIIIIIISKRFFILPFDS